MTKKLSMQFIMLMVFMAVLPGAGCERFDRSRIKMPEFNFATTENLHSIAAVDAQHMWLSGSYGEILFSADGGKTWQKQPSGIDDLLLGPLAPCRRAGGQSAFLRDTRSTSSTSPSNATNATTRR